MGRRPSNAEELHSPTQFHWLIRSSSLFSSTTRREEEVIEFDLLVWINGLMSWNEVELAGVKNYNFLCRNLKKVLSSMEAAVNQSTFIPLIQSKRNSITFISF